MGLSKNKHKRSNPVSGSKLARLSLTWGTEERRALYQNVISATIRSGTFKKYEGRIKQLEEFAREKKQSVFQAKTMEDFILVLSTRQATRAPQRVATRPRGFSTSSFTPNLWSHSKRMNSSTR